MAGRDLNQERFKPGVDGITLMFSAGDTTGPVYTVPLYERFRPLLEPLLDEVCVCA